MNPQESSRRQTTWWVKMVLFITLLIAWKFVIWLANDGPTLANPFVPEYQTYYQSTDYAWYGFPFNNFGARDYPVEGYGEAGWHRDNIVFLNVGILTLVIFGIPAYILLRKKKLRRWMLIELMLSIIVIMLFSSIVSYIFSKIRVG